MGFLDTQYDAASYRPIGGYIFDCQDEFGDYGKSISV